MSQADAGPRCKRAGDLPVTRRGPETQASAAPQWNTVIYEDTWVHAGLENRSDRVQICETCLHKVPILLW